MCCKLINLILIINVDDIKGISFCKVIKNIICKNFVRFFL